jgi:hypothetical protein
MYLYLFSLISKKKIYFNKEIYFKYTYIRFYLPPQAENFSQAKEIEGKRFLHNQKMKRLAQERVEDEQKKLMLLEERRRLRDKLESVRVVEVEFVIFIQQF